MIAEILSIGTELLMGQIANTDAQYISRRLAELGVNLYRHTTVGDNPARVKEALGEAIARADIVITTGIAGPDGGTPEKPVGLVYVGVASTSGCEAQELHLRGERDWSRELTCVNALNALRLALG